MTRFATTARLGPIEATDGGKLIGGTTILGRRASQVLAVGQLLALCAALVWLTLVGAAGMGYNWQWYRVPAYLVQRGADGWEPGLLTLGLFETCRISLLAFALTLPLALAGAVLRLSRSVIGNAVAQVYVELIRNTPLLVQLYLFYFVLGPIIGLDRYWTAVLALAVFEGAFGAEVLRAGIQAVPRGQWEAAFSLGLGRAQAYRDVVLPQALRLVLPPMASLAITLVKHSSIVSVIAVSELTTEGRNIISQTYMSFEIWLTVAAMYLLLTLLLSALAARLERRLAAWG